MQAIGAVDIRVAGGAEHSAVAHRPAAESMRRRIVRAIGLGFDMMPPTPRKSSVTPCAAPASQHSAQHGWARTTTRAAITRTCAAGRPARPRRAHRVGIARLVGELRRFTRRRRIFCRSVAGGLRVRFHGSRSRCPGLVPFEPAPIRPAPFAGFAQKVLVGHRSLSEHWCQTCVPLQSSLLKAPTGGNQQNLLPGTTGDQAG